MAGTASITILAAGGLNLAEMKEQRKSGMEPSEQLMCLCAGLLMCQLNTIKHELITYCEHGEMERERSE